MPLPPFNLVYRDGAETWINKTAATICTSFRFTLLPWDDQGTLSYGSDLSAVASLWRKFGIWAENNPACNETP
jgi:hypothetical protein